MPTKRDRRLGNQIRKARKKQGLIQEDLAELTKISVNHLALIEVGINQPSLKLLYSIAYTPPI